MRLVRLTITLSVMALIAMLVVTTIGPAVSHSGRKFEALLDKNTQPSNANPPQVCKFGETFRCTWVMPEAFRTPGARRHSAKAPKSGVIKKIKLIAAAPGSFRLQIAKIKPGTLKAKIIRNGPKISYQGQPDPIEPYVIETFDVNIPIKKGQSLAVRTKKLSALRCSSGGRATLVFYNDPLPVGGKFRKATDTEGCFMLIRAIMK